MIPVESQSQTSDNFFVLIQCIFHWVRYIGTLPCVLGSPNCIGEFSHMTSDPLLVPPNHHPLSVCLLGLRKIYYDIQPPIKINVTNIARARNTSRAKSKIKLDHYITTCGVGRVTNYPFYSNSTDVVFLRFFPASQGLYPGLSHIGPYWRVKLGLQNDLGFRRKFLDG